MTMTDAILKISGGKRCRGIANKIEANSPSISIIMAVFNGNITIEETINSIIRQNYKNFEYIIIDAGSTDGTIDTIKKYDEFIDFWTSEPDKGIYDALNKGIDLAFGDWLYFIGADDRLASYDVLSYIFNEAHKSKMLYGNVILGDTGQIYDGEFSKKKLYFNNICHQAIFYHKDLFRTLGKFELKYPLWADWVFNMRAFAVEEVKPVFINKVIAIYSIKGKSSTTEDEIFKIERALLIKDLFGTWQFIKFKWLMYTRTSRIIDILMHPIKAWDNGFKWFYKRRS